MEDERYAEDAICGIDTGGIWSKESLTLCRKDKGLLGIHAHNFELSIGFPYSVLLDNATKAFKATNMMFVSSLEEHISLKL
ncbi:hypothetical protein K2173_026611 [Erythroxylum novogranatense]|uniref:Uncharacterized protein n=1 Tax=Erythroxylum novogranatense TaxID=1862640 RepID=A0AAV8TZW8_9ROSI|nr:hypothetical protein K2173_026611 [Erythroxylum novogranatense]